MDTCTWDEVLLGKTKGCLDEKYYLYQTIGKGQYARYFPFFE